LRKKEEDGRASIELPPPGKKDLSPQKKGAGERGGTLHRKEERRKSGKKDVGKPLILEKTYHLSHFFLFPGGKRKS